MKEHIMSRKMRQRQVWVNGPYVNARGREMYVINITADLARQIAVKDEKGLAKLVKAITTRVENSIKKAAEGQE